MTWVEAVLQVGKWYEANIHTYQQSGKVGGATGARKYYNSPWGAAGDDCTAYVSVCLTALGVFPKGYAPGSGPFADRGSDCAKKLIKGGFQCIPFSGWGNVRPFDIVCVYRTGGHHHSEVYAGNNKSYSWGTIRDNKHGKGGMPGATAKWNDYLLIWRHNGTNIDSPIISGDMTNQLMMNQGYGGGLYGLQQETNAYPVHDEYVTITALYGNIFESTSDNAISVASLMNDSSWLNPSTFGKEHVRIYSTNDSSIVLDELSLPLYHKNDNYANKGIVGERERDNTGRIDRSLYETTDSSTNTKPADSSTNKKTKA